MVGWSGGWSEDWRVMLNSTQDQIKLKLKFELSLAIMGISTNIYIRSYRVFKSILYKFLGLFTVKCVCTLIMKYILGMKGQII